MMETSGTSSPPHSPLLSQEPWIDLYKALIQTLPMFYLQFLYSLRKCGYQEATMCCYGCVGVWRQKGPMLKRHSALRKITNEKVKGM